MSEVVKREDIARPVRRKEKVECAELGGAVGVRQMTLQQYLETTRISATRNNTAQMAAILADCVVDADDLPIFSEDEWNAWGPAHMEATFLLYTKVRDLSGIPVPPATLDDTAKN